MLKICAFVLVRYVLDFTQLFYPYLFPSFFTCIIIYEYNKYRISNFMLKLIETTYVVTHHLYSFPFAYISSDDKLDTDFDVPCLQRIFRYQLDICIKR